MTSLMLSLLLLSIADDTTLYSECDQESDLRQQLELASELESDLQDTVAWGRKCLLISMLEKLYWFCLTSLITSVLLHRAQPPPLGLGGSWNLEILNFRGRSKNFHFQGGGWPIRRGYIS